MSGLGVCAEQDFKACVVEWESSVGLWDQLVQETLATSMGGSVQAHGEQDGAYGWASIGDQRVGMTERLDQGLRRAEAPSGQVDAMPQTYRRLSWVCGWRWGGDRQPSPGGQAGPPVAVRG